MQMGTNTLAWPELVEMLALPLLAGGLLQITAMCQVITLGPVPVVTAMCSVTGTRTWVSTASDITKTSIPIAEKLVIIMNISQVFLAKIC